MRVNEIFYSCQGEGVHAGIPMVFIRLQGCNLRCTYCDTSYTQTEFSIEAMGEMKPFVVCDKARSIRSTGWFVITGGEPLHQSEAVGEVVRFLKSAVCKVEVETNGSLFPPEWFKYVESWVVDVKCPSSGSYGTFDRKWLKVLRKQDQLKFVVGTEEDLDFVRGFVTKAHIKPTVLVSPTAGVLVDRNHYSVEQYWNRNWLQEVWEFCCENNLRFSLQVHKAVYGNERGV